MRAAAQTQIDEAVEGGEEEAPGPAAGEQCLQSFNEQLGDFLKDLQHYGGDEPGKAIIQSSKYLERLLDAARLMVDKEMFAGAAVLDELTVQLKLQGKVKGELIAARKGNLVLVAKEGNAPVNQEEQRRAYACAFMKKLGVTSVAGLAKKYSDLGMRVNAAARKALAQRTTVTQ